MGNPGNGISVPAALEQMAQKAFDTPFAELDNVQFASLLERVGLILQPMLGPLDVNLQLTFNDITRVDNLLAQLNRIRFNLEQQVLSEITEADLTTEGS